MSYKNPLDEKKARDDTQHQQGDVNLGTVPPELFGVMDEDSSSTPNDPLNIIQTILALAMNLVSKNDVLRDRIAKAPNALTGI